MGSQLKLGGHLHLLRQQLHIPVRPNNPEMIGILRQRNLIGEPLGCNFIHEVDAYSAAPADLVDGRQHAPGTDQGDGAGRTWFFISPASWHQNAGGGSNGVRQRSVRGRGGEYWRTDAGKQMVVDAGGRTVGYTCTLCYVAKAPGPGRRPERLGWYMIEYWLEQQDGGADQQLLLCKVYRSKNHKKHPKTSTAAASSASGVDTPRINQRPLSIDGPILPPLRASNNDLDPAPCPCVPNPVRASLSIQNVITPCVPGQEGGVENPTTRWESVVQRESGAMSDETRDREKGASGLNLLMAFGGSSIPSAERMKEMAKLVVGNLVVVMAAMGKTTNNILLAAEKAVSYNDQQASEIHELVVIKDLHLRTVDELGLDRSIVLGLLNDLEQNLQYVARTKVLTPTTRHYLVAFGEQMSTTIFSAYLNKLGKRTQQYAFDIDFKTTDDFGNVDILEATHPSIAKKLKGAWIDDPAIPIVTCSYREVYTFFKQGSKSCAITTLGSDLTAMIIGKALGSEEIQIWKDIDGVLTGDPNICTNAIPVSNLTFAEATELAYSGAKVLHPQSMRFASGGGIPVIKVKNSYNPQSPGTMITKTRDMSKSILSSIVLKPNIAMFDQLNFEAQKLDTVVEDHENVAVVLRQQQSIISLVGNIRKSSFILAKAFSTLERIGVNVLKVSHSWSKVMNVSLVVHENEAKHCVQVLHSAFLEDGFVSKVEGEDNECPVPLWTSSGASSSGVKRKADDDHPEAPPNARQERADTDPIGNDPMPAGDGNDGALGARAFEVQLGKAAEGSSGPRNAPSMQAGGANGGCPGGYWAGILQANDGNAGVLPAGGGDQAAPQSAPGAETEVDAGQSSWTGHQITQHQLSSDNDLRPAVGDPGDFFITEDFPGQFDAEEYHRRRVLLPIGGGDQAMPESAPGAVTEEDAGQGSWTATDALEETQHPLFPGNDLTAVAAEDLGEIFGRIINEDVQMESVRGDDGRDSARFSGDMSLNVDVYPYNDDWDSARTLGGDEHPQTPIDDEIHMYLQSPIDLNFDSYLLLSPSEAEPEQLPVGDITIDELLALNPNDVLN